MARNQVGPEKGQKSDEPFFVSTSKKNIHFENDSKSKFEAKRKNNDSSFTNKNSAGKFRKFDNNFASRNKIGNKNSDRKDSFFGKNSSDKSPKFNREFSTEKKFTNVKEKSKDKFSPNEMMSENRKRKPDEIFSTNKISKFRKSNPENSSIAPRIYTKLDEGNYEENQNKVGQKFRGKGKKTDKAEKKPFDKKKWRLKKYSKKYRLEQWEERRKKAVLKEYYKNSKDDKPNLDVQKIYEEYSDNSDNEKLDKHPKFLHSSSRFIPKSTEETPQSQPESATKNDENSPVKSATGKESQNGPKKKVENSKKHSKSIAHKKAQLEFERLKQEKLAQKEEFLKKKAEKEEALKVYKQKKNEKYKILNKKTKRGQPLMKGRIEMLLEKIQSG